MSRFPWWTSKRLFSMELLRSSVRLATSPQVLYRQRHPQKRFYGNWCLCVNSFFMPVGFLWSLRCRERCSHALVDVKTNVDATSHQSGFCILCEGLPPLGLLPDAVKTTPQKTRFRSVNLYKEFAYKSEIELNGYNDKNSIDDTKYRAKIPTMCKVT